MITPEELKALPDEFEDQIREIERYAIEEIAKATNDPHLAETGITLALLMNLKKLERHIAKLTGKALKDIDRDMRKIVDESILREVNNAKAAGSPGTVSARTRKAKNDALKEAKGKIDNLTGSMGFHDSHGQIKPIGRIYIEKLNECMVAVQSGTMDYRQAAKKVCKDLSRYGLYTVDYATGHKNRMDTAARRAIITGVNQAAARTTEGLIDDLRAQYVETTAHLGARPDHQTWQGQVFSYRGDDPNYPDFVSSTDYGSVTGLCGANCRHNFFIFWPGASSRAYTDEELSKMDPTVTADGKEMKYYEATQKQRYQEREMRKTKREIYAYEAAGFNEAAAEAEAKLTYQQAQYNRFSRQVGIRPKWERIE